MLVSFPLQKLLNYFNKKLEESLCLKCLGPQMLIRYFILWMKKSLPEDGKKVPQVHWRKTQAWNPHLLTLSPVLNICSLQPQHPTSPESWLQQITIIHSFLLSFSTCVMSSLVCRQLHLITGSKKRRKNFLEINFIGSGIFSDHSVESIQSPPTPNSFWY